MAAVAWDAVTDSSSTISYTEWNKMCDRIKTIVTVAQDDSGDYKGSTHVAIQAAIDTVNIAGGGVVFIKAGTYTLGDKVTLYDNIYLLGEGNATILKMGDNIGKPILYASSKSNILIKNMYLYGNKDNQVQNVNTHGIQLETCLDCKVENVHAYQCRHHGMTTGTNSSRCIFTNCISDGNRQDGIVIGNSTYCAVVGCIARNSELYNGIGSYSSDGSNAHNIISNCICYSNTGSGINVEGGDDTSISNCHCYGNAEGSNVYVSDGGAFNSDNINYSNCNFSNNTVYGMSIHCNHIKLTGCEIKNNGDAGIQLPSVKNPSYLIITGCNISYNTSHGIQGTSATYLKVDNCTIVGNGVATANRFGIYVGSAVTKYSITNNHILSNSESGIKAIGSNGIILGNTILNNAQVTASGAGIDIPAGTTYLSILGNQIYDTLGAGGTQGYGISIGADTTDYLIIFNNMLKGNKTGAIYQAGSAGAHTIKDHNIES